MIDSKEPIKIAKQDHLLRQREGHKTPDWEGLSELMKQELIYQAKKKLNMIDGMTGNTIM